jgi:2-hydroxy-6-oxonona-2,4-dienedioate hydrolase
MRYAVIFPTLLVGTWCWERQSAVFARHGLTLRQFDTPFVMADCEPSVAGIEARCAELLAACDGPAVLAGNSLGGFVALRLALRYPDKVLATVISGAPGLGPTPNLGIGTKAMMSPTYANMVKDKIFADPSRVDDATVAFALERIAEPRAAKNGIRLLRSLRGVDLAPEVSRLATPTAMIWGAEDQVSPAPLWREASEPNPHIRFSQIAGSGHSPMYETPDAFNTILDGFLLEALA